MRRVLLVLAMAAMVAAYALPALAIELSPEMSNHSVQVNGGTAVDPASSQQPVYDPYDPWYDYWLWYDYWYGW